MKATEKIWYIDPDEISDDDLYKCLTPMIKQEIRDSEKIAEEEDERMHDEAERQYQEKCGM